MVKIKEYELSIEQMKVESKRVDHQEKRKNMEIEADQAKRKAEYQDQLARRRYEDQLVQNQRNQEEILKKQEESVAKQEAMRKSTLEHEMELRAKADTKRIEAEMVARAKVERENQDLTLEQIRLKAKEHRTTVIDGITTAGSVIGAGLQAFLTDWDKVVAGAASARLGKPSLVRDTSRTPLFEAAKHPVQTVKKKMEKPQEALSGIVLAPTLEARLRDVALATKNTKL